MVSSHVISALFDMISRSTMPLTCLRESHAIVGVPSVARRILVTYADKWDGNQLLMYLYPALSPSYVMRVLTNPTITYYCPPLMYCNVLIDHIGSKYVIRGGFFFFFLAQLACET